MAYATQPSVAIFPSADADQPTTTLSNPNSLGAPLVFLVVGAGPVRSRVMLPERPNGATGWVANSDLRFYQDDWKVVVSLSRRVLTVLDAGRVVETDTVTVGSAASPTPTGSFYVTELVSSTDPGGPYGPYAFGLSDFSDTYTEFAGGPGQVAIHGTDRPDLLGQAASDGCVRLPDATVSALARVLPVGTPVDIGP
ncbi:MAG TPA: L,D-transpeptidase [Acidimicrobiales bacterium]|nr:L,D-transpeptidase [Acidimicrobiales bacterium]